ncbi:hypothetical protein IWW49_002497 [Coemansia sp. RSA 1797]|nr:hypothetical protein IWW49_002497 [Coemansia sp. RSA 1797]
MATIVVVFGATGHQGGSVLRALATDSLYHVRAVTRSTTSEKVLELALKYPQVEWVEANVDDSTIDKAVTGAHVVFGMTQYFAASANRSEAKQGQRIIDACVSARVEFVVFSTLPSALQVSHGECTSVTHFEDKHEIQQYLAQQSVKWAIVQSAVYFQNVAASARWDDNGKLAFGFFGDTLRKLPYIDVNHDFGTIVKHIIDNRAKYTHAVVPAVSGYYSPQEIVEAFTRVTKIRASAVGVPFEFAPDANLRSMFEFLDKYDMFEGNLVKLPVEVATPEMYWEQCRFHGPPKKL